MDLLSIPGITSDQQWTLIAWAVVGSFIVLLVAGLTNRVVVFADNKDLAWTLMIFVGPIIAFLIAATLVPEGNELVDEPIALIVMGFGGIIAAISGSISFIIAIKHNGLFLGIVVGIFKVLAGLLAGVCAIGLIAKIFGKDTGSFATRMFAIIVFGALLWMMNKLINGDEVHSRRA